MPRNIDHLHLRLTCEKTAVESLLPDKRQSSELAFRKYRAWLTSQSRHQLSWLGISWFSLSTCTKMAVWHLKSHQDRLLSQRFQFTNQTINQTNNQL